jgi:hypothetical protein
LLPVLLVVLLLTACAPVAPTPTPAPVVPTAAPVQPTAAPVQPTAGPVQPTATAAPVAPTSTPVAPTAVPPTAVPGPVVQRIEFKPGATSATVPGRVAAGAADTWIVRALAGQQMTVKLNVTAGQAVLSVVGANGSVLLAESAGRASFVGNLPFTQDYNLGVRNTGSGPADYALTVTIPGAPAPTPVVPTSAAPTPAAKRIEFPAGGTTATVQGRVNPNDSDTWVLRASAGQKLTAKLAFTAGQAILIIWGADGTVLISDHAGATEWEGDLPITQDYNIHVRNVGAGVADYSLTVTIPPKPGPTPVVEPTPVPRRIQFPAGGTTATVTGRVAANGSDAWLVGAQRGQEMSVNLNSAGQVKLVIWGADGTVLVSEGVEARSWKGPLPATQDYTLRVRNLGSAAADYSLTVTIPPLVGPTPVTQRITFPAGGISATVNGQVAAGGSGRWVIGARANQRMTASLAMRAGQAILVIWGADGTVLQSDHVGAGYFEGPLPKTQDYFIDVKCSAAAACNYALTVTIPPAR